MEAAHRGAAASRHGACTLRRALLASAAAVALAWPMRGMTVRVSDVPLFATLNCPAAGRLGQGLCTVPAGSTVEMLAEVAGPGVAPVAQRRWFVRVLDGACQGAELSVPQAYLRDERDTPTPPDLSTLPPR
jgi:hypothetical protein